MNQYSVRKYFYVDIIVEAASANEANETVNDMDFSIHEAQYLGDLENEQPDILEI
jgi:hypothetical protein